MIDPLMLRVPENAPGDFYVVRNTCIHCCLPHGEAPSLLNDCKADFDECYFRRQPTNETEVDQAINAMNVSCVEALRYAGNDARILAKLRSRNMGHLCNQNDEAK